MNHEPEELAAELTGDNTCGWRRAAADVDTQVVPGGHLTCITGHVGHLAAVLKGRLEQAQAIA